MAMSFCKNHGETISSLLSPKASNLFNSGKGLPDLMRISESIDGSTEWGQSYLVTEREISTLLPSLEVNENNSDAYDDFLSSLTPVCSSCLKEWVEINKIHKGALEVKVICWRVFFN